MPKRAIYIAILLFVIIFFINEYTKDNDPFPSIAPIEDEDILETYPELFEAVENRHTADLFEFTSHNHSMVQKQAWRALASTPIDSITQLLQRVEEQDDDLPWFALSRHELTAEQLRQLEDQWQENPHNRGKISLVFGQQGNEESLSFLLSELDEASGRDYEYDFALAIGRLMTSYPLEADQQQNVVEQAFSAPEDSTVRAYLYGFYRGNTQEISEDTKQFFYNQWSNFGLGSSVEVDQYMVKIVPEQTLYEIGQYYNSENRLDREIQLAIELAQALEQPELDRRQTMVASILLRHENPHVIYQTLQSLRNNIREGENHMSYLRNELLPDEDAKPYVWTQALKMAATIDTSLVDEYGNRLRQVEEDNPYLLAKILEIHQIEEADEHFLDRIAGIVTEGEPMATTFSLDALQSFVNENDQETVRENRDQLREIVFNALDLTDRGVSAQAVPLLENSDIFEGNDFAAIHETLEGFELPEDLEVYQAFGKLYIDRFEQQAETAIDSLAELEDPALNQSLADAGWEVDTIEESPNEFRNPDWETFPELGEHPIWVLETNRGDIKIEVNTLSAPVTASAIDSLTRAGAYDGVPFHRVVPNFVIQGGDIERQDGFGSPSFTLPTEASEKEFNRGAAGIANAGIDTEGSQYFLMHQWKPHLNGRYTRFGQVKEGMETVDEIVPGDSVESAYWE